jgi:hypothetical protein
MKKAIYKHAVRKKANKSQIVFDNPEMWIKEIEGLKPTSRYFITIEEENIKKTPSQLGFLFGGIYKSECMNSNAFSGLSEKEIHQELFRELEEYPKVYIDKKGEESVKMFVPDFNSYNREEVKTYIDKLIAHLATEYDIYIRNPEEYKQIK